MKPPRFAHRIIKPQPWVPAASTDIAKTIARARKQLAEELTRREAAQLAGIAEFDSWATEPIRALRAVSQIRGRK